MKSFRLYCQHFVLCLSLIVPSISWAQTDLALQNQKAECSKHSSSEWSSALNKCVGKVEDRKTRHDAKDCNTIEDLTQREECHKKLAEQKTGLNSDPNSLNQGNTTGSAVMNGVGSAYAIVGMINGVGKNKKDSECMSKKIFGITAMAGFASDIYLKIRAKKKVKELEGKYKLETKQGAYDAQVKALQYLKEEQETVADIAGLEKKRNMLLMLGYGAASVMAIYEMATMGTMNAGCFKPDPPANQEPKPAPAQTAVADGSKATTAVEGEAAPAAGTPPPEAAPVVAAKEPATTVTATASNTPPAKVATEGPVVDINHSAKNGKQFLDIQKDPTTGARSSIIDNNVVNYKTGEKLGTIDYQKGIVNYKNGSTFPINNIKSTGFAAPVSVGGKGLTGNGFDWRSSTCRTGKC